MRYENVMGQTAGGIFNHSVVPTGVKNNAQRWIVTFGGFIVGIIVQIHIHLAGIGMVELADLEVDQNVTFQNAVIEY